MFSTRLHPCASLKHPPWLQLQKLRPRAYHRVSKWLSFGVRRPSRCRSNCVTVTRRFCTSVAASGRHERDTSVRAGEDFLWLRRSSSSAGRRSGRRLQGRLAELLGTSAESVCTCDQSGSSTWSQHEVRVPRLMPRRLGAAPWRL